MRGEDSPLALVSTRPDAAVAKDIRERLTAAFDPVLAILNEATDHGLQVNFSVAPLPPFSRIGIVNIVIVKPL